MTGGGEENDLLSAVYLDKEKDIAVDLRMEGDRLFYTIRTPNHHSGNLITNLARLCDLKTEFDDQEIGRAHV